MKYSFGNVAVFKEVQAATRWLSHGDAADQLMSRFNKMSNALGSITEDKHNPEVKGIKDELLDSETILFCYVLIYLPMSTDFLSFSKRKT